MASAQTTEAAHYAMSQRNATRAYYEALLDNPNVQRGLHVVKTTEGTIKSKDPYATAFGGGKIKDLSKHPNKSHSFTQKNGKKNRTTAAGAYQFLSKTWNRVATKLGLTDFTKKSQDLAALALIDARNGLEALLNGDLVGFINAVGPEWASLPTAPDAYSQPKVGWNKVTQAWESYNPSGPAGMLSPEAIAAAYNDPDRALDVIGGGLLHQNAAAHAAYGKSRALNQRPTNPDRTKDDLAATVAALGLPSAFTGRPDVPVGSLPAAYGGPANRPMPSGRISAPAAPSALGRSLGNLTKDDRVSITSALSSAMGRTGAQMSPNGANRTKDDNARSLTGAAPSATGTTIGRGGYSPPGSGFKAENVDRGLLGADPASSFRADNIDRSLTGANPRASDVVSGPNAPSWAGRPGVAGSMPAAPSGKLSPSVAGALAQRAGLEAIKDEDLSQVLAKTTVTHPPNPTVGLPPAVVAPPAAVIAPALVPRPPVQPRPVVVAPAPQAMPSKPVAPALRPSDIYAGVQGSALDSTGKNTVSRDAYGNTTVTNQYGATTGMTPGGYQTAYGSMGALPGITGPTANKIGGAVKGALPGLAGSTVGGLLGGPLGALLGAALAKAATQSGGILSGMQSFNTNAFGTINAAKAQGGGAFPDAPRGGYGSGGLMGASYSNRSDRDMDSISPGASAAIGRGQGGLY